MTTTNDQIRSLRADRDALLQIAESVRPEQWQAPSGCAGWNTKDLVSHLGSLFWAVVDGSMNPDTSGLEVEEAASVHVESRRALNPAEVLADYEDVSSRALEALAVVAKLDVDVPFSDFESYPASVVPLAFCFDHYTHIRFDLVAPRAASTRCRRRPTRCGSRPPSIGFRWRSRSRTPARSRRCQEGSTSW